MKSASAPLIALLNSGQDFISADLWTITLPGGTVIRWSGEDTALSYAGNHFVLGPAIKRAAIRETRGLEVANLAMEIKANAADLINGTPLIPFIKGHGLDGALVRLDRGFGPDWASPLTGTIIRFSGKVTSVPQISGSTAKFNVASWAALLNTSMPANLFQAACLHTVYDAGCTLNAASFASSGTVSGSPTKSVFASGLSAATDDYALGRVVFTSGPNTGISRTIKSNAGGTFTLLQPLPAVPAVGNGFTVYPGCDRTHNRCSSRFANLIHFKGTPFVPPPETAL